MKTANKSLISHISSAARAAWAWAWAADLPRSKNTESDHLNDHLSDHLVTSEGRSSSGDVGTGFCVLWYAVRMDASLQDTMTTPAPARVWVSNGGVAARPHYRRAE